MPNNVMNVMQDDWVLFALPLFLLALAIEYMWSLKQLRPLYSAPDFLTSIGVMLLTAVIDLVPKFLGVVLMFVCYEVSPLKDVVSQTLPFWVLLFFLDDFTYYWFHRGNHEVRLMWAGHVSHHNSQFYNLGTALRQGVGERVIKYLFWCPLALLGFDPVMIVTMLSISLIYQYWIHTQAIDRMPAWFELIFNTPSHHRVHHASNVRYLDRNHGATLIIWDRLFGTFSEESADEPVVYGLTKNLEDPTVMKAAFSEYGQLWRDIRSTSSPINKLRYLFYAPGWSHDGVDRRSNTLRAQF